MPEKRDEKGLSTNLRIILFVILVVVAAGVIFFILREKSPDDNPLDKYNADLKIEDVQVLNNTDIAVKIDRNTSEKNIEAVVFVFYDDKGSKITSLEISIENLEEVNFHMTFHFTNISKIKKISVTPIFQSKSGSEIKGDIEDEYKITSSVDDEIPNEEIPEDEIPACTMNSQCNDNNVCTTNTCSNGNCFYVNISNDCVPCEKSSQCEDSNACTANQCTEGKCTYLSVPGCTSCYSALQCNDNNSCTDNLCVGGRCLYNPMTNCSSQTNNTNNTTNTTVQCTSANQATNCNDNNVCTTNICLNNKCVYSQITSCVYNDGCCPTGCNSTKDNDCSYACGNNIKEGTEKCDGTALGGATCAGVLGTGYTGTLKCSNCMFNTSLCVAPCTQTCASLGYQCGTRAICGKSVSCGNCSTGFNCNVNGTCIKSSTTCTTHASSACYNGDVYWYNSCNVREGIRTDCISTQTCSNGVCTSGSSELNYIVRNGVGSADIIISSSAPSSVEIAADELQTYIQKMSGAVLPIRNTIDSSKSYHIYVGRSSYTDALEINTNGCKHDGFKMISGDNYLALIGYDTPFHYVFPSSYSSWDALTGHYWENPFTLYNRRHSNTFDLWEGDGKGSLNAVYQFLQDQGVRWYYPGDIGEIVPTKKDIGFYNMNILKNPDFELREWFQYNTEYKDEQQDEIKWQLRMRLTTDDVDVGAALFHGLYSITMRDEQRALHPEYFDQSDCGSCQNQVDLCSAGVFQEDLEYLRFMFDTYDVPMMSVMPTDGLTYAAQECEEKNNFDRNEYGEEHSRQGWTSDYVWPYVNEIAWELYDEYPDKKISCSAYTDYTFPPLTIDELAPNVVVFMDRPGSDIRYSPEEQMAFYTAITNDWLEKIPSKTIYTGGFFLYQDRQKCPVMYPHLLGDQFKFYYGKSKGDFMEVKRTGGPSSEDYEFAGYGVDPYLTAQLYWDNNLDVDALLEEYYRLYYGPAASDMKQFMEYAENNYYRCDNTVLNNLKQIAASAKAKAGNTIYGERIDMLITLMNS